MLQREADHLLVIAEQGLDCQYYHDEWCDITWSDCTLRRWLNVEFYNKAFNEQERKCVLKTSVVNNAGPNTEDYVFLLSVGEAKRLFANDRTRCAELTEYAVEKGAWLDDGSGYCWWWLRSCGYDDNLAAYVLADGGVNDYGHHVTDDGYIAVRPAFKIAL